MEKLTLLAIVLFVSLPFFSETAIAPKDHSSRPFTIVIDPGHGGKDSGALGSTVKEKDVSLKLALRLGAYIRQYMPNIQVLYTRSTDVFIPLHKRIELANNYQADIFFSIHCNALANRSSINGTETYVMGLHSATENLDVAKRENKAVLLEQNYTSHYQGYDPNSSEGHIMLSMYQNAYLTQSLLLAEKIESQFKNQVKRKSRGVKQAGFLVLRTATMPSVLVETGFLTNTSEEQYLNSEKGQVYMASAMYRAIKNYKEAIQGQANFSYRPAPQKTARTTYVAPKTQNLPTNNGRYQYIGTEKRVEVNRKTTQSKHSTSSKRSNTIVDMPSIESMYPSSTQSETTNYSNKVVFRVQLASGSAQTDLTKGVWASIKGVELVKVGSAYKCLIGQHTSLKTAVEQQAYWRKNGFKDAFVVAFRNGKKVAMSEVVQ